MTNSEPATVKAARTRKRNAARAVVAKMKPAYERGELTTAQLAYYLASVKKASE